MRSGVSINSVADQATFAGATGTWDADYPVSNLGDLLEVDEVSRVEPDTGAIVFTATLPAAVSLQFFALVNHTLPADATVRVRAYSDVLTTGVFDSTATAIPAPVRGYDQVFPVVLDAALSIRSIQIDIASAGSDPIDIGALEIGGFWQWPWLTSLDAGFKPSEDDIDLMGGGTVGSEGALTQTRDGEISYLDLAISATTGLDFQKLQGLTRPLVYVENYADPTTWPRGCFLATNSDVPPAVAQLFDRDQFQIRFRRHAR